ncbi:MAG: hypothetical protein SFU27_12870, partial [Thermonemataceae bacterium]|nr:hypothetical protein [Thermonemataceae bacterium]
MQKCLAKFIVIFLFAPLILKAQVAELVAHYPLNNSGEELGQKYTSMKLINTIFSGGGTYTEGVYDDFGKQKGNAVLSPFISEWDLGNFYLSLSFKASRLKKMPIFMIGSSARLLGLYISPEGQLQVEINNHNLSYAVEKISLKHSQWYLLQISLKNQELQIFLDKTLIFSKKNIILNEQYISSDKNISSVDFGNGNCFEGYWKDLKISKTSSQSNNGNSETTATALETPIGKWETTEINVPGNATQDYYTKSRRKFFLLKHTDEKLSLIWQDEKSKIIYYTVFSEDLKQGKTSVLNSEKSEKLLAACIDDKNNLYYAVSSDDYERNKGNDILSLYKTDKNGGKILKKSYNSDKKNLDIFAFGNYAAALSYNNQTLAIFMARTMNKSGDGLNHQGGIALVFDSNTLEIIRNTGQTSGHSFDNFLMASKNGNFIGVDLGDNYPR